MATLVNEPLRLVAEFDHKPALEAYAQSLGVSPEDAAALFIRHPLGLMVDTDPFVRSPLGVQDRGIKFYCQIKQGMELAVLEATDIVAQTRQAIETRKATGVPISGIIDFQCILRTLQLREKNRCEQYGAIFDDIPTAGFSIYGEAYLGHINQTSTILVFR
ncbi:FIST domain protein (fragment) [Candidatus Sulfopaludibacter sp. SbA3]